MKDLDFGKELIRKKIPLVSNSPGVYRMLDKKNQVLYVGKAKNLPNRLKSLNPNLIYSCGTISLFLIFL